MRHLKFKHVFAVLMMLSFITAFLIPSRFVLTRVPGVQILFAPVSRPSGAIAGWASNRFAPQLSPDQRDAEVVKRENEKLKDINTSLSDQLNNLQLVDAERKRVGSHELCTPYSVIGSGTGARASLAVQGSSLGGLRENMVALCEYGIVGKVQNTGIGGTQVRLITDLNFRELGSFARFEGAKYVRIPHTPTVVEGNGRGAMMIRGLTLDDVTKTDLRVGDSVVLNDTRDWPKQVQGHTLGKITRIEAQSDERLWANITVRPTHDLLALREVSIMTKEAE